MGSGWNRLQKGGMWSEVEELEELEEGGKAEGGEWETWGNVT